MSAPHSQWTQPGHRRRKITIAEQTTGTRTGMGFLPGVWVDVLDTWALVTPRPLFTNAATQGEEPIVRAVYLLNIRYNPSVAILPGMRVTDGSAYYLIQNVVDVDERHREWNLYCSQIPAPAAENQ